MKSLSTIFTIVLGLLFVQTTSAQDNDLARTGSFYSGFGLGMPMDVHSPYTNGMGLSGVASFTNMSPSISNPAHWGLTGFTQGSVALSMNNFNMQDNTSSVTNALFAFDNFQLVVPLLRNQLGASISFTPMTRSDFRSVNEGSFSPIGGFETDPVSFQNSVRGTGGINRFEAGFGLRVASFLSVGYGFSANLLSQQQERISSFSDGSYRNTITNQSIEGYGFGHRFGVFFNKGEIFGSEDQISLGATVNLPVNIEAERTATAFRTLSDPRLITGGGIPTQIDLSGPASVRDGTVKMPLEFNAGLVYNFSRYVNVATEVQYQEWGNAEYSYSPAQEAFFKDRMRAGLGLQYHPYRFETPGGFFSNFKYSVGTSYDDGHLAINGENIETLFLNAGIGIVSQRSSSSVDLNFHYGIRGTQSSDLVKENIWGFTLSLNLAEYMFVRQRFQ
ncbi:MAG: hypothetical protein JJU46_09810 [Balneolaceae bacterium]|nr:hypothetical protein [Balneolaceae bacterium]MCH8547755.1 hypothetical protein [Balneolaceae bacterium]